MKTPSTTPSTSAPSAPTAPVSPAASCPALSAENASTSAGAVRDQLFYDGQCPLCLREMDQLRDVRGDEIELVDIHSLEDNGPVARDTLLRTLHLRRADGAWLRGADANVAAWEGTRQAFWLRMLRWPILRHFVDLGYALWAQWRYRRLYGKGKDKSKEKESYHNAA